MSSLPTHAVVVLAAGASTRLGQPKQLLRRDGEVLLHRVVRLAAGTAPAALLVVLPDTHASLADALHDLACTVVFNQDPQRGMASSLATAAPHVQGYAQVLILACDQPALDARHLHTLLGGARHARSGCAATRLGPLRSVPAVVPGHWFDGVADGGDSGFRARLRALDDGSLALLDAPELGLDIDTPDDLRRARSDGLVD